MATITGAERLRSYHFSLGDSTDDPVGYCARVLASSEEAAVELPRAQLQHLEGELRLPIPG